MGIVYLAEDPKLKRRIAIKVLPKRASEKADRSTGLRAVDREAQILASINHPNIATIFSLEEADGHACLTMELVSGETLADKIIIGRLAMTTTWASAVRSRPPLRQPIGKESSTAT